MEIQYLKKFFSVFIVLILMSAAMDARDIIVLDNWKFQLGEHVDAKNVSYNDDNWEMVQVPHDWAINKPFDMNIDRQMVQVKEDGEDVAKLRTGRTGALPAFGIGWYRKKVVSTPEMKNKSIFIEFDGVMSLSKIYLNGKYVGEWPYGYSSFTFDLTSYWNNEGNNVLAVRIENKTESSRWYSGAGIYRHVKLVVTDSIHIAHWGTFIATPVVTASKTIVDIKTKIENCSGNASRVVLQTTILDAKGVVVGIKKTTSIVDKVQQIEQQFNIKEAILWGIENPYLYSAVSAIYVDGLLKDSYTTTFGIRKIRFDKDKGFFLNEEHTKIKGVCLHHDLGPLGAAVNKRAIERQLEMMKEMGCNAIRTSHNPPAPELLDLCDKMGFLVQVEAFDEWKSGKHKNGYGNYFDLWHEKDLIAMIHRDRNHPSVIMWSIGNEIREQTTHDGAIIAKQLAQICKREDATCPVTAGFNLHYEALNNRLIDEIDLVGFNYKPHDYKAIHEKYPHYILYGSETASTVSSRGVYKFPAEEKKHAYYDDYQLSSYDYEYPFWASTPDTEFEQQDDCDFIFGEFVWTGFDYLGEPTPYNEGTPARSSYFGIVDLAGLKKDRFYLYQSKWSDKKMLHLLPHWNWEDKAVQKVPVYCYTNYPKAELFVNGKSQGVKKKSLDNKYRRYRLMWEDVKYKSGEITVVAYDEAGNRAECKTIRAAGKQWQIRLTPDRSELSADGKDLSFITVEVLDKEGNLCPKANPMLFFDVTGNARLKAVCNGDATDQTAFSSNYMRTFNGKMVMVVESSKDEGEAIVKASGNNLQSNAVTLKVRR